MSEDGKSEIRLTVEAFLQSKSMNEAADYVARGRAHQGEGSEVLKDRWIEAFRLWAADHNQAKPMDDLRAELELRGEEPPYEAVKAELDAVTAKLAAMEFDDEAKLAVGMEVEAYARARSKPSA